MNLTAAARALKYQRDLHARGLCGSCREPLDRVGWHCDACLEKKRARRLIVRVPRTRVAIESLVTRAILQSLGRR